MLMALIVLGLSAPPVASRTAVAPKQAVTRAKNSYEAGSTNTRRTHTWRAPTISPNSAILSNLTTLRDRSREAVRNNGYAAGAIERLVTSIVGVGMKPMSKADDPAFRTLVDAAWLKWTDECDADGMLDFYGQQSLAVRSALEGGDSFVRLRPRLASDGLTVPLQLQVLEAELCPHSHTTSVGNTRIRAGIEFDPLGRRTAYWFHPSRPAVDDFDASQLRRVPADLVIQLMDLKRAGQLRGVPVLTQALVKLWEIDKFDDATVLRQQLSNMVIGVVTRPADLSDPSINPLTGEAADSSTYDAPFIQWEPGTFQEADPGSDVKFNDPPGVADTYEGFMRQQLYAIAASVGVPYELLSGDLSKVNDRTVRVILTEFRRRMSAWQHQVLAFQFCRRVWLAWMDRAFLSGALPIPPAYASNREPWARVEFKPHRFEYINPVQDVQAQVDEIRSGLTSRSAAVSERGEDAALIDAEQANDNARADDLGLIYDSDPRYTSRSGLTQARPDNSDFPAAGDGNGEGATA